MATDPPLTPESESLLAFLYEERKRHRFDGPEISKRLRAIEQSRAGAEAQLLALRNDLLVSMNWLTKLAYPGSVAELVERLGAPKSILTEYEALSRWFPALSDPTQEPSLATVTPEPKFSPEASDD